MTDKDFFLPPELTEGMETYVKDPEFASIEDCGHWTQRERPERVNEIPIVWLDRRVRAGSSPAPDLDASAGGRGRRLMTGRSCRPSDGNLGDLTKQIAR